MPAVILDTSPTILLIVGLTDIKIIKAHDNLAPRYTAMDYVNLSDLLSAFSDIFLLPHVLAEVSNLSRQIKNPYRSMIQNTFENFIDLNGELNFPSIEAVRRPQFLEFGITDCTILNALDVLNAQSECWLVTDDGGLATQAEMAGHNVLKLEDLRG